MDLAWEVVGGVRASSSMGASSSTTGVFLEQISVQLGGDLGKALPPDRAT
jgi:hypothetical protein